MKSKLLAILTLGVSLTAVAQGYQDGVDNFNAGRLDEAKTILNNTLNVPETNQAEAYFYLGWIDVAEGNLDAAKSKFDKGVQIDPAYGRNYIGLGELALRAGNKSEAEKMFQAGLKTDKKNTALMADVARAYWNVNPTLYAKEIDKYIAKAFKESKNTEPAVYVLQGDMQASSDPGQAAGLYEMAISQDADRGQINREAYVKYANTYFGVNPEYAIAKLEEFNKVDPNSALAQRELAEKYYDKKLYGRAWKQYEKYVENPNHFRRDEQRYAGLLYSAGEYARSIDWANKVLQQDPSVYPMYRILTLNYQAKKQWPEAVKAAETLFSKSNPDQIVPNDYVLYGTALLENDRAPEAVAVLEKAVALFPDNTSLQPKLSAAYERAGNPTKAIEVLKAYLDAGNGSVTDLYDMANNYASLAETCSDDASRQQATDEAIKYIDMAIERLPNNESLVYAKAGIYLTGNNNEPNQLMAETYEQLLQMLDKDPTNLEKRKSYYLAALKRLGVYYAKNNRVEDARNAFTRYLEINPEDAQIAEVLGSIK